MMCLVLLYAVSGGGNPHYDDPDASILQTVWRLLNAGMAWVVVAFAA
jgi:hypothetical protein